MNVLLACGTGRGTCMCPHWGLYPWSLPWSRQLPQVIALNTWASHLFVLIHNPHCSLLVWLTYFLLPVIPASTEANFLEISEWIYHHTWCVNPGDCHRSNPYHESLKMHNYCLKYNNSLFLDYTAMFDVSTIQIMFPIVLLIIFEIRVFIVITLSDTFFLLSIVLYYDMAVHMYFICYVIIINFLVNSDIFSNCIETAINN